MASGMPSSRQQIARDRAAFSGVSAKLGCDRRGALDEEPHRLELAHAPPGCSRPLLRSKKSGIESDGTGSRRLAGESPAARGCWRGCARRGRAAQQRGVASCAHAATRCSQLSSTSSSSLRVRGNRRAILDRALRVFARAERRRDRARRCARASETVASSTSQTPCAKRSSSSAATCSESRVLPVPPEPVSVTSRERCTSSFACVHLALAADEAGELRAADCSAAPPASAAAENPRADPGATS